jgi:DNA helicase HerA-like ATPase
MMTMVGCQIMELNLESKLSYSKAKELSHEHYISSIENKELDYETKYRNQDSVKGKLAGFVNVIGYRDRHSIVQLPNSPFHAGQPVFHGSKNLISRVLGLNVNSDTGAYVGLLRNHNMKVLLDINSLVQKHVSIIAKTGSGKSYIVGILVEELLKRKIPVVIIDPHGEYSTLMHPNIDENDTKYMSKYDVRPCGYPDAVREYSLNPKINLGTIALRLSNYGFTGDGVAELLGLRGTGVQTAILYKAINRLMSAKNYFTLRDLRGVIEMDRNSAKWHLLNSLENLMATGIFSDQPTKLIELVQPGRAAVINLRGAPPQQQQLVVTQLSRQLFEARKLNKIPGMMLILEEAHQFCPQQGRATSSNIIHTIASEGRKFGLGLGVVSQRPAMVDKNVLSQCNSQVILKVTNPNDLKAIISSVEGLTTGMIDEIQRLPVSVAIAVGGEIQLPIFIDVRVRETKHGGRPTDIFQNVENFASEPQESSEDIVAMADDEFSEDNDLETSPASPSPEPVIEPEPFSASEELVNIRKTNLLPEPPDFSSKSELEENKSEYPTDNQSIYLRSSRRKPQHLSSDSDDEDDYDRGYYDEDYEQDGK